jgi:hypothetical protein
MHQSQNTLVKGANLFSQRCEEPSSIATQKNRQQNVAIQQTVKMRQENNHEEFHPHDQQSSAPNLSLEVLADEKCLVS